MPLAVAFALPLFALSLSQPPRPMVLSVDAREAPRRLLHAALTIPVKPGPLALEYPKWIPGEHGPTGPLNGIISLKFFAGGKPLAWRRNPEDLYEFDLVVPEGVTSIRADLDYAAADGSALFGAGNFSTEKLMALPWNVVLLYPKGQPSDAVPVRAEVRLPDGWRSACALKTEIGPDGTLRLPATSLTTLVDSPLIAGEFLKTDELRPGHFLAVVSESEASATLPKASREAVGRLVDEAAALFGSRHYRTYTWLLTLSDYTGDYGLEHHESSDDRGPERTPERDPDYTVQLLAHEYVHSWNGKYRRPTGLATGNFDSPMRGDLLWIYEGLTNYLGFLLAARSGGLSPEYYRDHLADLASYLGHRGRDWRPLADTAVAAQILYGSAP